MRIAVVSTPFVRVPPDGYGGTELFCYELVEGLAARGHDVTLYATGDAEVSCRARALFARPEWPPDPADEVNHCGFALESAARERADLVHVNSPLAVPFTRFVDMPVVHTIHHRPERSFSRIYAAHPEVCYVAISRRQRELEVPLPRTRVIHHGLDPARYPFAGRDDGFLLHLGRYCAEKGTHLAIEVARAARLPIVLAGRTHPQDRAYFDEQLRGRLRAPFVREVGEAGTARKVALFRSARALVCPLAWEEPFGLVAIEAMLCGTPVLGFARGAFPEIVDEGVTGFLAAPGDLDALVARARELDGFDRQACARRARERFDAGVMVRAYEALYRDVVAGRLAAA
jgi:glycosyltransferase involved in cell wall biosynthesis